MNKPEISQNTLEMNAPGWVEEQIRQQQLLVADLTAGMQPDRADHFKRRMTRLADEFRSVTQEARRQRIDEILHFWTIVDINAGDDMFVLDTPHLAAHMEAIPEFGKLLKMRDELWKRKVIFEYPEYWELYSENGSVKSTAVEMLRGLTRLGQEKLGVPVDRVSPCYLLYQMARRCEVYLERLATGAVSVRPAPLQPLGSIEIDLGDEDADWLSENPQSSCWALFNIWATAYFDPIAGDTVELDYRFGGEEYTRVDTLVLPRLAVFLARSGEDDAALTLDAYDISSRKWLSERPLRLSAPKRGAILEFQTVQDVALRFVFRRSPDAAGRSRLREFQITAEDLFETYGERVSVGIQEVYQFERVRPVKGRQLRSGLTVKVDQVARRVSFSHADLDISFSTPFPDQDRPVELHSVLDSNFAFSYSKPVLYRSPPNYIPDGERHWPVARLSAPVYTVTAAEWDDGLFNTLYLNSRANLFKSGETTTQLMLENGSLDDSPIQCRKFANLIYCIVSEKELQTFDLFQLCRAENVDPKRPLVAGKK